MSLLDSKVRPKIKHQAGTRTIEIAKQAYLTSNVDAEVIEFIDDMAAAYQWADVIICRAGALTVSEVTAAGLPAIFVPYPHAVDDHQRLNAESVSSAGGAIVLDEKDLDADTLSSLINGLLNDFNQLNNMRQKSYSIAKLDAVKKIAAQCLSYAGLDSKEVTL